MGGRALYFTRAPVPYLRTAPCPERGVLRHVGIYGYRRDFLLTLAALPRTPLETCGVARTAPSAGARIPHCRRRDVVTRRSRLILLTIWNASAAWRRTVCFPECAHGPPRTETGQVHLRHGRRGVVAGQGAGGGVDRLPARGARLSGDDAEARSVHQRRPRHDEPVPARRGVRHRRRRRDGSRPGALRAVHQYADDAQSQLDHRPGLHVGHPEGAARRLPGADDPGDSAHHQRDQGVHPRYRQGRRHRHRRDRRHGRRHREPAVPRGHSSAAAGRRPREHALHPPDAGAVHRHRRAS